MGQDHKGQPSGTNKSEGTGISSSGNDKMNKAMSNKYMQDEDKTSQAANEKHPNRNRDKGDATNAGGYKN